MKHFGDIFIISRRRDGFVEIVDKRTGVLQKIPQNDFDAKYGYEFENKNTLIIPGTLSLSERLALDPSFISTLRQRRITYVREKVSSNRKKRSSANRSLDKGGAGVERAKRTRKASAKALLALERSALSIGSSTERTEEQKRAAAEILRLFKL